jgi:hypothetical protein
LRQRSSSAPRRGDPRRLRGPRRPRHVRRRAPAAGADPAARRGRRSEAANSERSRQRRNELAARPADAKRAWPGQAHHLFAPPRLRPIVPARPGQRATQEGSLRSLVADPKLSVARSEAPRRRRSLALASPTSLAALRPSPLRGLVRRARAALASPARWAGAARDAAGGSRRAERDGAVSLALASGADRAPKRPHSFENPTGSYRAGRLVRATSGTGGRLRSALRG